MWPWPYRHVKVTGDSRFARILATVLVHSGPVPSAFNDVSNILINAAASRAFPAAVIEVGRAARPEWRQAVGTLTYDPASPPAREDTIFDLASLTKVLSTTPLVMRLVERGGLGLDDPVARYLRTWRGSDREAVTIRDLLSHSSGLPAYQPFYRTLRGREAIEQAIVATPLEYPLNTKSIYSDLGFMLLGFILADVAPLDA